MPGNRKLTNLLFVPIFAVPILFVSWLVYSSWHVQEKYQEGRELTDKMTRIESDFRTFFHGKSDYPAFTLEQLKASGALSPEAAAFIASHHGSYVPFSPGTPPDTVVLTIRENMFSTWDFTKDELTRPPAAKGANSPME